MTFLPFSIHANLNGGSGDIFFLWEYPLWSQSQQPKVYVHSNRYYVPDTSMSSHKQFRVIDEEED